MRKLLFVLVLFAAVPSYAGRCFDSGGSRVCVAGDDVWTLIPCATLAEAQSLLPGLTATEGAYDGTRDAMIVTDASSDFPYLVLGRVFGDAFYEPPGARWRLERFSTVGEAAARLQALTYAIRGLVTAFDGKALVWYDTESEQRPHGARR